MIALFQRGRISILQFLSKHGRPRVHINELARQTEVPLATCWRAVDDLRGLGLVLVEKHGSVSLVTLNTRSPAVTEILRTKLPDPHRMAYESFERRIRGRLPKLRVRLFGSVARGEATPHSDVDALVEYGGTGYPRRRVVKACTETVMEVTDEFMIPVTPLIVAKAEGIP